MDENNIEKVENLDNLETQIKETQKYLEENTVSNTTLAKIKKQRTLFAILTGLFLLSTLWLFFNNNKSNSSNNFELNKTKDSLNYYKNINSKINKANLSDQKIVYNVQIGAFQNFELTATDLMNLKEFSSDGYNKMSLGYFTKYQEASNLKASLIQLGFKDCFIIAQSFGNQIDIRDALLLSNETEYLNN